MKLSLARPSVRSSNKSTALLVLVSCNLVLLHAKLRPQPPTTITTLPSENRQRIGFEPISFIASRLLAMTTAYLSAVVYVGKQPTLGELYSRMQRTWRRPAVTLMYIELFATATASLLLMISAFARAVRGAAQEAMLVSGSIVVLSYLGPAIFGYSDIVCKMGLVESVADDGCEGMEALKRAGELVEGMKVQGLVLTTIITVVEQAAFVVFGLEKDGDWSVEALVVAGPIQLVMKFFAYFACTMFYNECKKRKGTSPVAARTPEPGPY